MAIQILETFTSSFTQIREECLDDCLETMIRSLQLIYEPDIDLECKENIKKYFYTLYFQGDSNPKKKDFVYNAIKNFAE